MEDVAARFYGEPLMMIGITILAFVLSFVILGVTAFLFAKAGREQPSCWADGVAAEYGLDAGGNRAALCRL